MYYGPYQLFVNDEVVFYNFIVNLAQAWADNMDAMAFDANGVQIPDDVLWDVLG